MLNNQELLGFFSVTLNSVGDAAVVESMTTVGRSFVAFSFICAT